MTKIINLRQARKTRTRTEKRAAGDANAAKFGEVKALRDARQAQAERAERTFQAHRKDDD